MIVMLISLHKIFDLKRTLKSSFSIVLTEVCYQKNVLKSVILYLIVLFKKMLILLNENESV